ncbi:GNAT superfamily N-acetyltransferase [Massilia aurea]|uniref:GNAT superfamily N-acetyltransferase n=1 Tax=Massilia aurea TaxID=373040 RepID=A0A7W9WYA7_9BURK|nr:GNAT family N-acetyltransferase [Massilia aurea]MBB6133068.1 GNAT superfamily N-acetyltransferase [Massilia aurea]
MTESHPTFRQASVHDIPAMSRIRLSVNENRLRDPPRITPQMYADFLEKDGRGWVALVDGEIVAFSYANRIDGSIWALFVDPRFEGQGLGKQLLSLATDWLFSLGFRRVTLSTGTHTRAAQFYTRLGWRLASSSADDSVFVLDGP